MERLRSFNLDAELNAMEQAGRGRVASSPRVFTTDRNQAKIIKGFQVPSQQSASDGTRSVSFKESAHSLDVTPLVNRTGVLLEVVLSKDEPDYSKAMNGVPPINTTSLTSRVLRSSVRPLPWEVYIRTPIALWFAACRFLDRFRG
jgi:type IV pilus assembly protein PilQ